MSDRVFVFKNGAGGIRKNWSGMNQAWLVWRQDATHQSQVRIHNAQADADEDFEARVEFYNSMK